MNTELTEFQNVCSKLMERAETEDDKIMKTMHNITVNGTLSACITGLLSNTPLFLPSATSMLLILGCSGASFIFNLTKGAFHGVQEMHTKHLLKKLNHENLTIAEIEPIYQRKLNLNKPKQCWNITEHLNNLIK